MAASIFAVSVVKDNNTFINKKLVRITPDLQTFRDMFNYISKEFEQSWRNLTVSVSLNSRSADVNVKKACTVTALLDDDISLASEFDSSLKEIVFSISSKPTHVSQNNGHNSSTISGSRTVNEVLMAREVKMPQSIPENNQRDKIHNTLVKNIQDQVKFPSSYSDDEINQCMKAISCLLWFMDGRKNQMLQRQKKESAKLPTKLPERLEVF